MKFTVSIVVNQPLKKVTELFANPRHLKEYQEGFARKELLSGREGQDGAVSMMYYKAGKREMELRETITANRLPASFEATYHHKFMDNTMKCIFTELSDGQTQYDTEIEYTRIDWLMPRLMAILFPGVYRKQVQKWLVNFKTFVEAH